MATTYSWFGGTGIGNTPANWTPSGPPSSGDTAIINAGTLTLGGAQLNGNTIYLQSAELDFSATSGISFANPTLDGSTVITTGVTPVESASTATNTVLSALGNFISQGTIQANGPAGSTFTIAVGTTTVNGTVVVPGNFVNYDLIEVDAGNTMTISIGAGSELANAGQIQVNGGTLIVNANTGAIAGGFLPVSGAVVIAGGGKVETNAAYGTAVAGATPTYAFSDATAGNTLKIDNIGSFAGQILGFGTGDTIDVGPSLAVGKIVYSSASGVLALLNNGGTILGSVQLVSGNYQSGTFTVSGGIAGSFGIGTSGGDTVITSAVTNDGWNNSSGTWQTAGNWSNGVPGTLDTAFIGINSHSTFVATTGPTGVSVGQITLADDHATLQITSNTTAAPYGIQQYAGTLEVTSGNTLSASLLRNAGGTIQLDPTAVLALTGHVSLSNVGAVAGTLAVNSGNTIGARINGNLLVNGATINAAPSAGGGGGNIFIGLDSGGTPATVTVQNSGTNAAVVTDSYAQVSSDLTSYGVLTLNGNVTWTDAIDPHDTLTSTGKMVVGINNLVTDFGTLTPPVFTNAATLTIENGATLLDQSSGQIGASANSGGTVLVQSGGLWNIGNLGTVTGGGMVVGALGQGWETISNAGTVSVGTGGIAVGQSAVAATGTIVVTGTNSLLISAGGFNIGKAGQGELDVLNGGSVQITGSVGINLGATSLAAGHLTVSGAGAVVQFGTLSRGITVGGGGTGTLDVESGGSIVMNGTGGILVGQSAGAFGSLTINGSNAALTMGTIASGLTIGVSGSGVAQVSNGGSLTLSGPNNIVIGQSAGAVGTLTVTGPNAIVSEGTNATGMTVGQSGSGVVQVTSGGTISVFKGLTIGANATGQGTVTVSGAGSSITTQGTSGTLNVGSPGTGVLSISNGGSVSASSAIIVAGGSATSSGTITVDAGTLTATAGLSIGSFGAGTVTVKNGGTLSNTGTSTFNIGNFNPGGNGTLIVDGGSVTNGSAAFFGVGGTNTSGTLVLKNGGRLTSGGTGLNVISALGTGVATALISGGTWTANGQVNVGDSGTGTLTINSNGILNAGTNQITVGNQAGASGTVSIATGTLLAGSLNFSSSPTGVATGIMTLGTGAVVSVTNLNENGNSSVILNGGRISATNGINVGSSGTGASMTIGSGGTVSQTGTFAVQIGSGFGTAASSGTVTVNTGGTLSSVGGITIANSGGAGSSGFLTVNGGLVNSLGALSLGQTGTGQVTIVSGTLSNTGMIAVGGTLGSGTLSVQGGALIQTAGTGFNSGGVSVAGGTGALLSLAGGVVTTTGGLFAVGGTNTSGTLQVGAGGTLTTTVSSLTAATVDATGTGQAVATVGGIGAVWNLGGQLNVGSAGHGALAINSGGYLNAGTNSINIGLGSLSAGTITVNSGGLFDGGALTLAGISGSSGTLVVNAGGKLSMQGGIVGTATVSGIGIGTGGSFIMAGGTVNSAGLSQVNGLLSGFGSFIADVNNSGTVLATGGLLDIGGSIVGNGIEAIDTNSTLEVDFGLQASDTVSFLNGATAAALQLNLLSSLTQDFTLNNWQNNERLVIANGLTVTGAHMVNGNTLEVTTNAPTYDFTHVTLAAGTLPIFNTGSNYVELVSCFAAGTLIETTRGPVAVEALREGDRLPTTIRPGSAPIIWTGWREIDCTRHPDPRQVWPVRIMAGALGDGLPERDLFLSPDHAVYLNDVLIPARHLVNGSSITQVKTDSVTYYHVELPEHDVILAEGVPAETYLDVGDRRNFANGGKVIALYPNLAMVWEAKGAAPLVVTGPALAAARAAIDARAAACLTAPGEGDEAAAGRFSGSRRTASMRRAASPG